MLMNVKKSGRPKKKQNPKTTITVEKDTLFNINIAKAKLEKKDSKVYTWDSFFERIVDLIEKVK